ncbi:MAG: hypothetical protein ACNA7Z_03720 [Dethiobacteria bacterium]
MGRLEKARAEKSKGKTNIQRLFLVIFALLIVVALFIAVFQNQLAELFAAPEADFIDMERSVTFIDMFELTYVRIYLNEGVEAETVTANGLPLEYNREENRWELVTGGYEDGAEVAVTVTETGGSSIIQEIVLIAREL